MMKQAALLLLAIAAAAAAWWWLTQEMPRRQHEREVAAEMAAVQAERANSLYRWRDDAGSLHVTQTPPQGRKFERISRTPKEGMDVHGDRP